MDTAQALEETTAVWAEMADKTGETMKKHVKRGIRITMDKEFNSEGLQGYRITSVQALTLDDLPELYLMEGPSVFMKTLVDILPGSRIYGQTALCLLQDMKNVFVGEVQHITKGNFYTVKQMEFLCKHIADAGENLARVNKELKRIKAWNGTYLCVDGLRRRVKP